MDREETNRRAAATTNRIVRGLAEHYAGRFGEHARIVTIQELPSLTTRSTWAAAAGAMTPADAAETWRELGPGYYLWSVEAGSRRLFAAVNVDDDGSIDFESVDEVELPAIQNAARLLRGDRLPN